MFTHKTLAGTEHFAVKYIASSSNLPTLSETGLQKGQGLCKPYRIMGISGCSHLGRGHPWGLKYPRLVFLTVGSNDLAVAYSIKNIARHPPYI